MVCRIGAWRETRGEASASCQVTGRFVYLEVVQDFPATARKPALNLRHVLLFGTILGCRPQEEATYCTNLEGQAAI